MDLTKESTPSNSTIFVAAENSQLTRISVEDVKHEEVPAKTIPEFPEGGRAAWATALGALVFSKFCGFGYTTSFGVYQDFFVQHYLTNESASTIAWIGSLNAFLTVACSIVSGPLYDRGYFYHLMISGALLQSFSLFMLSLAKPGGFYQVFLTLGLGNGLGQGLLYVPTMAVVSQYFRRRRTFVMTLVASGSSVGSVIHPIMLNNLLNGPVGFATSVRASAGLVSVLLLIACLLMRTRLPPPAIKASYFQVAKRASSDSAFVLVTIGSLLFCSGYYYPYFYLQLDSVLHGLSESFSFYTVIVHTFPQLVILNASSFVGRFTSGFLVRYIEVPAFITIAAVGCSAVIFGMIGLGSLASSVLIGITFGYFAGVFIAMMSPLVATLTPDLSELG
ncbi:MFS general substrate transporter [Leucogyrophana mollusca]|uniref:MFS general substrate transporter n=1 Tax=Leucogyrophana mollusca TaxID=85980 RepID=A0ACB8AX08_9AGAM|nr:MFS general substrate transporter [Leucogyrophana mollusca]